MACLKEGGYHPAVWPSPGKAKVATPYIDRPSVVDGDAVAGFVLAVEEVGDLRCARFRGFGEIRKAVQASEGKSSFPSRERNTRASDFPCSMARIKVARSRVRRETWETVGAMV